MKIYNPATNQLIIEISEDSNNLIKSKFDKAKLAQKEWQNVPLKKRK